jgi:hypothetical protein
VPLDTAVEEFLAWEGKLTHWEEALFMREDEAWIPEQALVQASTALDEEWAKADATQYDYLNKIKAHTTRSKQVLDLNKVSAEKKVELDGREQGLELCVAALAEALARGLNP